MTDDLISFGFTAAQIYVAAGVFVGVVVTFGVLHFLWRRSSCS